MSREGLTPTELLDPDGEGIYLLDDALDDATPLWPGVLLRAATIFDLRDERNRYDWRQVRSETRFMYPDAKGETWRQVHGWRWMLRLNLPQRWRPVVYAYCTPRPTFVLSEASER